MKKQEVKNKLRSKKAVFFSSDALMALVIILLTILVAYPVIKYSKHENLVKSDVIQVLSTLKTGEIKNSYVQSLISEEKITDMNKSILEQIGEFYVTDIDTAKAIAESVLSGLDTKDNIGIWYGNKLIFSKNSTAIETAKDVDAERQIISGIREGENLEGFSARAFLTNSLQSKYFYFGGYVGDGNLSARIDYEGEIENIKVEIAINKDFDIYINDIFSGHYEKSVSDFSPAVYNLDSYLSNFHSGINEIEFAGDNLHITGGYIKINYDDSVFYEQPTKKYFPGMQGIINLYDGFYVPGNLNSMEIRIVLDSREKVYLSIGNKTIFNQSTSGVETITKTNSEILSILGNYNNYEMKTVPLRLGVEGVSYVAINNAYVFSVVDLSGGISSAKADLDGDGNMDLQGKEAVKQANRDLVDMLLDVEIVKIGLAGTQEEVVPEYSHALSNNEISLNNTISQWKQGSNLDLCDGIKNATDALNTATTGSDFKSIVLLGTKEPNSCSGITGNVITDTYNLACEAYTNYGIRIDTVGIIDLPSDQVLDGLLRDIAECTHGNYYNQTAGEDLLDLYDALGRDLLNIIFYLQTAEVTGEFYSYLSPDSYIQFNYTRQAEPYGLITTLEKQFDDAYYGHFSIPQDSTILEATAISYSGPRWTHSTEVNNASVYRLSDYGSDYNLLGDPYAINIPTSFVASENLVKITTGISPENSTSGSADNKIIYAIARNLSSYSAIVASAEGCIWNVQFEDGTNLTLDVPLNYTGADNCYYQEDKVEYNNNDALQAAVYNLLRLLDVDLNSKIDVKFTEQDLQISSSEVKGIPYTWSTEVQVRTWS